MKKGTLLLLILSMLLTACTLADITPSYYGRYSFAYMITQTKNGVVTNSGKSAGFMEVAEGSDKKTVNINNFVDSNGSSIKPVGWVPLCIDLRKSI